MSNYSPLVDFEIEFEGDTIKMRLKQLTRDVFLAWMPHLSNVDENGALSAEATLKLIAEAGDVLPKFVKDFKGLKDADGNAVGIDVVVSEVYFMQLMSDIVRKLIEISQVSDAQEGKSGGPQLVSSPESS